MAEADLGLDGRRPGDRLASARSTPTASAHKVVVAIDPRGHAVRLRDRRRRPARPARGRRFHHDNANSGDYTPRRRRARQARRRWRWTRRTLTFKAPGDDLLCGRVHGYEVRRRIRCSRARRPRRPARGGGRPRTRGRSQSLAASGPGATWRCAPSTRPGTSAGPWRFDRVAGQVVDGSAAGTGRWAAAGEARRRRRLQRPLAPRAPRCAGAPSMPAGTACACAGARRTAAAPASSARWSRSPGCAASSAASSPRRCASPAAARVAGPCCCARAAAQLEPEAARPPAGRPLPHRRARARQGKGNQESAERDNTTEVPDPVMLPRSHTRARRARADHRPRRRAASDRRRERADPQPYGPERRGRLPQHAAARARTGSTTRRLRRVRGRPATRPPHFDDQLSHVRGPAVRVADADATTRSPTTSRTRRSACKPGRRRVDHPPARRRDDRARQAVRRAARLRRHARRRDVRRRLRRRRRTGCSSWTCCATPAARSSRRSSGGAAANREMDRTQWELAPYTEADLQKQIDLAETVYGARGSAAAATTCNEYVAGINQYIAEAQLDPTKKPAEYSLLGIPLEPWKRHRRDRRPPRWSAASSARAAATSCARRSDAAGVREALRHAPRPARVARLPREERPGDADDDPRASAFPYETGSAFPQRGLALPDPGSRAGHPAAAARRARLAASAGRARLRPARDPRAASTVERAAGLGASSSATGHPIAVMGPQVGYFVPQILMEEDLHGPGIDARGAAFPGVNLYVELGHGRDYAWSATTAELGQHRHVRREALPGRRSTTSARASASRWRSSTARTRGRRTRSTHAAGLRDAHRLPHRARHRVPRAARSTGKPVAFATRALDLLPRGRLGARLLGPQRPGAGAATRSRSSARRRTSTSRSTGSTWTRKDIAYYQSGWYPQRAKGTSPTSRSGAPASTTGRASTPTCTRAAAAVRRHPNAINQPLHRVVEQQAGAGLGGRRRQLRTTGRSSARSSERRDPRATRGRQQDHAPAARADHGGRRAPRTCAARSCCR